MFESSFQLRIDPWATEYGSALLFDDEDDGAGCPELDLTVETNQWAPITPGDVPHPEKLVFVDGVQRIDARVVADHEGAVVHGAFASMAVGAVTSLGAGQAQVGPPRVQRVLALAASRAPRDTIAVPCGSMDLAFETELFPGTGYAGVAQAIDSRRRDMESALGQELASEGDALVVLDGRLRLLPTPRTAVVGYTKTLHQRYLDRPEADVLLQLEAGQRTPLFAILGQNTVFSWYQRLAARRAIDYSLAGVVRLETPTGAGPAQAALLADQTARYLPRFASTPERDPRAPQNLLPVGGLEARLRHEMGEQQWIRRSIEAYLHRLPQTA
jgi:hypothetical protein